MQNGVVTIKSILEVLSVKEGSSVLGNFGGTGVMDVAGLTVINTSVSYDGEIVTVVLVYSVYINASHVGGGINSKMGFAVQFAEFQHLRDLRAARTGLVGRLTKVLHNLLKSRDLLSSKQIANTLDALVGIHFKYPIEDTRRQYDVEGDHNGGIIRVPDDFKGLDL